MNTILVLIGGYDEQRPVVKGLNAVAMEGRHGAYQAPLDDETQVVVVTTGVGPEQARRAAMGSIERFDPDFVISAGTCGALVAGMDMSDWLVTGTVRSLAKPNPDASGRAVGDTLESPATDSITRLAEALGSEPRCHQGTLVTVSDDPVVDAEEKEAIARKYEAVAVDMESYGVARAASDQGIRWLIARVVVDTPAHPLPALGPMNTKTGRPRLSAIAWYVLKNPIAGPRALYGLWELVQVYARHLVRVLPALSNRTPVRAGP